MMNNTELKVVKYNEELQKISSSFSCGNVYIDNFLKRPSSLESDICKTFVLINDKEIVGFYSLAADSVLKTSNGNISLDGGAIRIKMFAINEKYQKKKIKFNGEYKTYASMLLIDCLFSIDSIVSEHLGAEYIILDATEQGLGLYEHTGDFLRLTDDDDFMISKLDDSEKCIQMYKYIKNEIY